MSKESEFWISQGVEHITPRGLMFPEGFNPGITISSLCQGDRVIEMGCGIGRLAGAFDPLLYTGMDINPDAIALARKANPSHEFMMIKDGAPLPVVADTLFMYTVALHVADENIADFLSRVTEAAGRVIIAEIMGRNWRREGNPPVFNRGSQEYVDIMKSLGYDLVNTIRRPYAHYAENHMIRLSGKDTDVTFLEFEYDNESGSNNQDQA
jgi:SAM-dependent methyltransferase